MYGLDWVTGLREVESEVEVVITVEEEEEMSDLASLKVTGFKMTRIALYLC